MMRFPYSTRPLRRPAHALGGSTVRHLPLLHVGVEGPTRTFPFQCRLDPGSDDTIFPTALATFVGVDLTGAPEGECQGVGGTVLTYRCATVTLRISDGKEECVWDAVVGFIDQPRRFGLLGLSGFHELFDVTYFGAGREAHITPNASFKGQHIVH